MVSFGKAAWSQRWGRVREGLCHAFAVSKEAEAYSEEDQVLLQRLVEAVVARRMAAPSLVFLESLGPMAFLGSQVLHMLAPIVEMVFEAKDMARLAVLLERREAVPRLIAMIEAASSEQRAAAQ